MQKGSFKLLPLPQGKSFACQLFAHDNCNILNCDRESISALVDVYSRFCCVSGSWITFHKTECLRLSHRQRGNVLEDHKVSWLPHWARVDSTSMFWLAADKN